MEISDFLDRLASALPGYPDELPPGWLAFRRHCEARYLAGVDTFGDSYRARNNPAEALEEAADLAMYMAFSLLVNGDEDADVAYMAAYHAYLSYSFALRYAAKRTGTP